MATLATIRQWVRGAFSRKRGGGNPRRRKLQDAEIVPQFGELSTAWQERSNRDEWSKLRCCKVMRSPPMITPDTSTGEALALLRRNGFDAAPVVDADQQLLGVVSVGQLTAVRDRLVSTRHADPPPVGELMITVIESVCDTDCLATAFLMLMGGCPCLPVIDWRGYVVGMLMETDILAVSAEVAGGPGFTRR